MESLNNNKKQVQSYRELGVGRRNGSRGLKGKRKTQHLKKQQHDFQKIHFLSLSFLFHLFFNMQQSFFFVGFFPFIHSKSRCSFNAIIKVTRISFFFMKSSVSSLFLLIVYQGGREMGKVIKVGLFHGCPTI